MTKELEYPLPLDFEIPTAEDVTVIAQQKLGITPCLFQVQATLAQLEQFHSGPERRAVVCITATGTGKTNAFILPLFFNDNGISILITPLNALGTQMERDLEKYNISTINFTGGEVDPEAYKDTFNGKYRVIIVSPEHIGTQEFRAICHSSFVRPRIFSAIFDEAHCISQWGDSFREAYARADFWAP